MTPVVPVPPVYIPTPGRCGAAKTDRGPYCLTPKASLYPAGWRCQQHQPINRKTGQRGG